jgi:hypothetical protein
MNGEPERRLLGNCPGCGRDEPFEQIHPDECPDADGAGCPEWACTACGAGVIMGIVQGGGEDVPAYQPVRAA